MADNVTVERTTTFADLSSGGPLSRLSWGGIWIGFFTTTALAMLFFSLGAAIGLTTISPTAGGGWFPGGLGSGIWAFLSFVVATFLGAWVGVQASRLYYRSDAIMEGAVIWAFSVVVAMLALVVMAGFAFRTTTALTGAALQAAGAAAQAGGEVLTQDQIRALQQQLMNVLPGTGQAQAAGTQAAQTATTVGAAALWWYFATSLVSLVAGILGGMAGISRKTREERPLRVPAGLRQQERHA